MLRKEEKKTEIGQRPRYSERIKKEFSCWFFMVKFKITYKTPNIPVQLKKLIRLEAKTPEEAYEEIKNKIHEHKYLLGDIKNLNGIEQQEMA